MKKTVFWILYLMAISFGFYAVNHRFTQKEASVYLEYPEETYGFTMQVQNHLGKAIAGVSFQLYEYRDSTVPISYLKRAYVTQEKIDTTYVKTTTKCNGLLHFYGLQEGIYYLEETDVPQGYQVLKERIMICVDEKTTEEGIDYYVINGGMKKQN